MNKNLQTYASWAEILSSIAVILTLIFLAMELRDNTDVARSNRFSDVMAELNGFRLLVNSDENLFPVWQAFLSNDFNDLDGDQRVRLNGVALSLFGIYENAYFSYDYGVLGEREWQRFQPRICRNWERLELANIRNVIDGLTPEFRDYIEHACR